MIPPRSCAPDLRDIGRVQKTRREDVSNIYRLFSPRSPPWSISICTFASKTCIADDEHERGDAGFRCRYERFQSSVKGRLGARVEYIREVFEENQLSPR